MSKLIVLINRTDILEDSLIAINSPVCVQTNINRFQAKVIGREGCDAHHWALHVEATIMVAMDNKHHNNNPLSQMAYY